MERIEQQVELLRQQTEQARDDFSKMLEATKLETVQEIQSELVEQIQQSINEMKADTDRQVEDLASYWQQQSQLLYGRLDQLDSDVVEIRESLPAENNNTGDPQSSKLDEF